MTTKEKARRRTAEWRTKNPERKRAQCKRYYAGNKERWAGPRAGRLRQYGITVDAYRALHEAQNGKCAVCGRTDKRLLGVDHDHVTGRIRGLLCRDCNLGLGCFSDDTARLLRAIEYLTG